MKSAFKVQFSDRLPVSSSRQYTEAGFLKVPGCVALAGNVQQYTASELSIKSLPGHSIVNVYRPHSAVFDPASLATFDNADITVEHPGDMVNAATFKRVSVGHVASPGRQEGDAVVVDLLIKDSEAIKAIEAGKSELSVGYLANYIAQPGTAPDGTPYDYIQSGIVVNHVALTDEARAGRRARLLDHAPKRKRVSDSEPSPSKIAAIRAQIDRAEARLDSYAETDRDAYQAYMDRTANAWKEQEQVEPFDRIADALSAKFDQMKSDLDSAANAGETGDGYVGMLEERADSLTEEVDAYIEAKKGRASESQIRATGDAAYQSRMDRLSGAWKDSDEKSEKEEQAESRKRMKEEQEAREFKPVFSGDAQATLDAAFKAKQQRMANAWKDGQSAPEAAPAPDLKFM